MASTSRLRSNNKKHVQVKEEDIPDPIIISSDEEEVPEPTPPPRNASRPRINFMWDWKKEVTEAIANKHKRQTLHVPAWVVRKYLRNKDEVIVRDDDTKYAYYCDLVAPVERGPNVRYLADGWYDYLDDRKPKVGDVLLFDMEGTAGTIVVKLVRKEDRRRR